MPRLPLALPVALLLLGPFAVIWGLLWLENASPWHSQEAELGFMIASLATGVAGLWLLPIRQLAKALMTLPYLAAMGFAVLYTTFPLVCAYFGDCL